MYELALFAGAGGGILGGILCGHTCVGAVEIAKYPRKALLQRQAEGILPRFPIWDDVTTFRADNPETKEYIEFLRSIKEQLVITGGFPCQDISAAGKGAGIKQGTRSGLWFEMARIIDEIRPKKVLVENSSVLVSRGLGIVLGDLAQIRYNAKWGVLAAIDVGAPHNRKRMWIAGSDAAGKSEHLPNAHRSNRGQGSYKQPQEPQLDCVRQNSSGFDGSANTQTSSGKSKRNIPNSLCQRSFRPWEKGQSKRPARLRNRKRADKIKDLSGAKSPWEIEPELGRVVDGVANRVDRIKALGDGQVPAVVYAAWTMLNS